jgi:hypothetical protein
MNNPFEGKAIKFATEQELNHLAELARGYGLVVEAIKFEYGLYFRKDGLCVTQLFSNYGDNNDLPEIPYSDFIASLESTFFDKDNPKPIQIEHPDTIARPEHYRKCSIEPFQIWRELSLNGFMGDALKYLMRLGYKDAKINELKKCIRYLKWEIENVELGIMQFTPVDAKCSVSADVIAKELGMSYPVGTAFHVVMNLHTFEDKIPALQTAINCLYLEISNTTCTDTQ